MIFFIINGVKWQFLNEDDAKDFGLLKFNAYFQQKYNASHDYQEHNEV